MLSVTGLNHFYYVRDFTDMRCKHSRVLSIIRERGSPDKPGGLSIQLCKSEKKEFYIRYSS